MAVLCRLSYSSDRRLATAMIRAGLALRPGIVGAMLLLVACGTDPTADPAAPRAPSGLPTGTVVIETSSGEVEVRVEIAETPEDKARGLMGRTELAPDAGMVFLEEDSSTGSFWMKDTLIPLSVAFWGEDGRIFRILHMEPCREEPCPFYDPDGAWVGALEVNQGFFEEHGVEVGDPVRLER
jgi:uncharacterized membrane protein (UPF0127 family)